MKHPLAATRPKPNTRIAFVPSTKSREYFEGLVRRLTGEARLGVRVTHRETFDHMVDLARKGERVSPPATIAQLLGKKPPG